MQGIVAAGDPRTAEAGATALAAGGNAIDAVCAAAFASFVVEPPLTSPAGAGVLLHGAPDRGFEILDFFATVPGLDLIQRPPLDFHRVDVHFGSAVQPFHIGRGSAAVPGNLQGLLAVHAEHGQLPLADVMAPAISLARDGFAVSEAISYVIHLLEPIVTLNPGVQRVFCVDDGTTVRPVRAGEHLTNPQLADFLEDLVLAPRDALQAFEALLVREFGPLRGGLLTAGDLARYRPVRRKPLAARFGPYEVLTHPPPSSGGGLVAFGLRLAESLGVCLHPVGSREHATALCRVLAATSALRGAGYDAHVSDRAAIEAMLDDPSIAHWTALANGTETPLGSTTHISVLDRAGGAASLTTSNGEGCGHTLPGLGIHVNNFLGEEDINPHGFHTGAPGSPMTTMMSPTVVLRDGQPRLVLGTGGSNRIRSAVLQTLLAVLGHDLPLERAVAAPRLHIEGRTLWYEALGLSQGADAMLSSWPDVHRFPEIAMFFGGVHAVATDGSELTGAGDPRRGGAVARA